MIRTFVDFFKNKEIRSKILFTLAMLLVFRFGASIPSPGVNDTVINLSSNSLLGMMNLLGGGMIEQMSIFALGVGPYITASIIIQLLSMDIIPPLAEMAKSGKKGRQRVFGGGRRDFVRDCRFCQSKKRLNFTSYSQKPS